MERGVRAPAEELWALVVWAANSTRGRTGFAPVQRAFGMIPRDPLNTHVQDRLTGNLQTALKAIAAAARGQTGSAVAASSAAPGMFGPILAFRGEIEAQGRGSLHPHILVWLLCMSATRTRY